MFKNLQAYRLPQNWACTAAQLEAYLKPHSFVAPSSAELSRSGWSSPRDNDQLVHVVNGQYLIQLKTQKRLLPASVINQVAKERAAELEEAQGFAPGKKAMKELKERVADELLPRAFPINSVIDVWIDPKNGWLVVDAATASKADDVVKLILKSVDKMPLESVRVARPPVAMMTAWLQDDEPAGFTIDMDATMQATGESKASISYKRHTLDPDDVRRHIAAGKQCTRLAMTWDSKISFVLTESLAIKSVKALDVLTEDWGTGTKNADERFDSDFAMMTGELAKLLDDLLEALGGEASDLVSTVRERTTPSSIERSVTLTAKLYASRTAARNMLGDDYHDKMQELGAEIEAVMKAQSLGVIEAAMAICQRNPGTQSNVYVMAAAVELVEPSEVPA